MKKLVLFSISLSLIFSCGGSSENNADENPSTEKNETVEEVLEIDLNLNKIVEIPSDCDIEGTTVDAYSWVDNNGINYFIRTMGELKAVEPEDEYADVTASQYLYAYHFTRENNSADAILVKETIDFVKDCEFDLILSHELDAITLTDIDEDEVGEITFIYRTGCTSDVSPSTQKLIMLENGDKYPLRGQTKVMEVGGDFTPGEEFSTAPEGFQAHAEQLWSAHMVEYDFEL